MSKNTGLLKMTGKIGDFVGYYRDGKQCFRTIPKHVNRSQATRLAATDFGTASRAGKLIRHGLQAEIDLRTNSHLSNRLNAEMLRVLYAGSQQRGSRSIQRKALSGLTGFKFNEHTELNRLLPFAPKVVQDPNTLRIAIPALEAKFISHAKNTTHVEIKAIAVGVRFQDGCYENAVTDKVLIDLRQLNAATELILPFKAGDQETIVLMQVTAFSEEGGKMYAMGNRKFCAADIIDIIPSLPAVKQRAEFNNMQEQQLLQLLETVSYIQRE